ncbi:MCE family protein [Mycolicibacterium sp. P9-22]|uniref:MCE family protein n=1 Tax=Mycolicibacterium sp. P9-22 TaxID=2024613 RepID=UPI0011EE280C|nr:MCE family protein [Mycolicibacterium sp. P9-22]KAA0120654.1 MCE family protein [Mycolicibacterium sp. P9-22]
MTTTGRIKLGIAAVLSCTLIAGVSVVAQSFTDSARTHIVAYFENSNGLFVGDEVRILGVPVGEIDEIQPQADRVRISLWISDKYHVPADVKAAILSPQLITARAIQLTPAYSGGPVMADHAVIPQSRTVVPVEWDQLREQLAKLTDTLQPTQPGGVSTLGAFVSTAAANLRGQGANIRDAVVKLSQAMSILGDHSGNLFGTINNLSVVVSALHTSTQLLRDLNQNLASATALLANDDDEVGRALADLNAVVGDAASFIAENREAAGTATDKLASISQAVGDSLGDVKQALHVLPNAFQNFVNIYQPSQATISGMLPIANFANPVSFLCGAIQAASRLNAEQSAKLCVQYLAPIIKNRQYNFPPIGANLFVGQSARPNELTYTEDWMRPDYVPPHANSGAAPPSAQTPPLSDQPSLPPSLPAEQPVTTDPSAGLPGLMAPAGGGS